MNSFPPRCHPRTGRSPGCSARDENPILGLAPGWRAARGQLCLGTKSFHPQTRSSLPLAPATRTQPIDFQRGISLPCALNCYNLLPRHESLWRGALDYAPCPVPSQALPSGSSSTSLLHLAASQPDGTSGSCVLWGNQLSWGEHHQSTEQFTRQSPLSPPAPHLPVPLLPAGIGSLGSVWE